MPVRLGILPGKAECKGQLCNRSGTHLNHPIWNGTVLILCAIRYFQFMKEKYDIYNYTYYHNQPLFALWNFTIFYVAFWYDINYKYNGKDKLYGIAIEHGKYSRRVIITLIVHLIFGAMERMEQTYKFTFKQNKK